MNKLHELLYPFKHKTLKSKRLIIRPYTKSDLNEFHRICSNPNIGIMGGWKPHTTPEESLNILRYYFMAEPNRWAITLKSSKQFIGSIGFSDDEKRNNPSVKSLGYWLAEEFWGQGLMSEAVETVTDYAFNKLGYEIITADCYPHNHGSRRVLEKCGFIHEGTLHEATVIYNGDIYDLECFYKLHPLLRHSDENIQLK